MKHRILSVALAILMILPVLASCAESGEGPIDTDMSIGIDTIAGSDAVSELTETEIEDDLPDDLFYDNDEIVILSRYIEGWTSGEIAVEKIMGDRVNDTVFERNKYVEERLGVKFKSVEDDDPDAYTVVNKIGTLVKAGTHEYDLLAAACYTAVNESLNGTFVDLRQTAYIDFNKPWWSQGFNEVVEYKGLQFGVTGALLLSLYRFSFATVFNKDMFTDIGIPHLYEDVKNGTWTLDRQIELVPKFHIDNGSCMDAYVDAARTLARSMGIPVADAYARWKQLEADGADITACLANHINHPTRELHAIFAEVLFETLDGEI